MNCAARAGCSREDLGKTVASCICLISEMLNLEPNKRGSSPTDFIKRNKTGPARSLETQKGRKKGKQDYNNVCSHEPIKRKYLFCALRMLRC
jgi:hypothetical protein